MMICRHLGRIAALALLSSWLATPPRANAHGETLIQIAAITAEIESSPTNIVQLYLRRGDLHREHQDWTAAEADYRKAETLQPNLPAVPLAQAALLVDTGHLAEADALLTQVILRFPKEGNAFIGRARVRLRLEQRKDAITDFQCGLELLTSPQPEDVLRLAGALVAEARTTDALRTLEQGIQRLGPLLPLHEYALQVELECKDIEPALRRIDTIIQLAPRKERWLAQRGDILLLAHRPKEAEKSFMASLKAIDALPPRLQQTPVMVQLIARVRAALDQVRTTPITATNE